MEENGAMPVSTASWAELNFMQTSSNKAEAADWDLSLCNKKKLLANIGSFYMEERVVIADWSSLTFSFFFLIKRDIKRRKMVGKGVRNKNDKS